MVGEETSDAFSGYMVDILDLIETKLDCKFNIQLAEDGNWGNYDETTGTWSGVVGEVINKKVDMAVMDLTIIPAREKGLAFTVPFLYTGMTILYKKTGELTINSLDDLLKQDKIKFGCVRKGLTPTFFRVSLPSVFPSWSRNVIVFKATYRNYFLS